MLSREQLLKEAGIEPNQNIVSQSIAKSIPTPYTDTIAQKREELELKKLEIEIAKLSAPNTSVDYFKQMLDLQQNHFNQLLEMSKQHSSLQLEIEKLKMGGDSEDSYLLDMIAPILPQILNQNKAVTPIEGDKKPKMNKEEYVKAVQEGKISLEQAYEDFKTEFPNYNMTLEQFKPQFEKVKSGELKI
jgi:hypothetical protein